MANKPSYTIRYGWQKSTGNGIEVDTPSWGKDRSVSNADPADNDTIVSTTHRDPEPAMDPNEDKTK